MRTLRTELDDAQKLLGLGVESPTLKKEIFKKLALKYLCDARQDVKDRIVAEIEELKKGQWMTFGRFVRRR